MAIDTTRNANGGVATTTEIPSVPASAGGDNSLLNYILGRRRIADERADNEYAKSLSARSQPSSIRGRSGGAAMMPSVASGGSGYTPQLGTQYSAPTRKKIQMREFRAPTRTPFQVPSGSLDMYGSGAVAYATRLDERDAELAAKHYANERMRIENEMLAGGD